MDLEAHSYEVHMKPYIHNFTWNLFELHKNSLLTSYELHLKFIWSSYEIHMKLNRIYSYEIHNKFIWTSHKFHMKWNQIYSYECTRSSYELHIEGLMKLISYTHVLLRAETIHRYTGDTEATVHITIRSEEDTIRYGTVVTQTKVRNKHKILQITTNIFQ